jgi:hypothetical protein
MIHTLLCLSIVPKLKEWEVSPVATGPCSILDELQSLQWRQSKLQRETTGQGEHLCQNSSKQTRSTSSKIHLQQVPPYSGSTLGTGAAVQAVMPPAVA